MGHCLPWPGGTARSSHPTVVSNGRPAVALGGLEERWNEELFFCGWGNKWAPTAVVAAPARGKEEVASGRATQGRGGEMPRYLCRLGPRWTRGTHGRTRALSGLTHSGPKSETEMGARGRVQTTLSVWVMPLSRVLCPRKHVRTRAVRLDRSAEDVLTTI
jgi:hypothetical protein